MKDYNFSNTIVLRTPLNEVETNITWEKIQEKFSDPVYREALYIASPDLYGKLSTFEENPESIKDEDVESLKLSLYKYYSRLSNRCTPFGLFAHLSTLTAGKESKIEIPSSGFKKAVKLDTFFLARLLHFIDKVPEIRKELKYFTNNSLYCVGDKYRYVEYYYKEDVRLHKISGVDKNEYLDLIVPLANNGAYYTEVVSKISEQYNVEQRQVDGFINTLIDNQFLISELDITLTGEDYLKTLIVIFSQPRFQFYEAKQILNLLLWLQQRLDHLVCSSAKAEDYMSFYNEVSARFGKVPARNFIQVDAYKPLENATLDYSNLKNLRAAVQAVNRLSLKNKETNLDQFAKRFAERYEENEVPLTQALDPDVGINYAKNLGAKATLIENLAINANKNEISFTWDKNKSFIFQKLLHAYQHNIKHVTIEEEDLNQFDEKEDAFPNSFSVFFNAFSEEGQEKLNLRAIWGPTSASLIGRFCHLDESLYNIVDEIYQAEEIHANDKVVAEIIHLPQARTGNVLYRKNSRSYEIPYLGKSSNPIDKQISVTDLLVSVKHGKVRLRSKKLGKEVIPRLSNAHNFSADALPIYHFLCDLASQGSSPLGFSWGSLQFEFPFLPRVSYKNIVLSRATWLLRGEDLKNLGSASSAAIGQLQQKYSIPNIVAVTMGDNEVVINFENELSRKVFLNLVKNKPYVELREFLFTETSITGGYANEFIVSAIKKNPTNGSPAISIPVGDYFSPNVPSNFSIGDEWLYYKFYCGEKTAEAVLCQAILPIIKALEEQKMIKKWFFVRYADASGPHVRFRLLMNNQNVLSTCVSTIKYHIAPLESQGLVWKTQVDTYQRENERYGYNSIDATESIFHADSLATLRFVNLIEGESGERVRWLFSLLSMDRLLADFEISLEQKVAILKMLKTGFGDEFGRKGVLNKQINDLYDSQEKAIASFLDKDSTSPEYFPLFQILDDRSVNNQPIVVELKQLDKDKKLPMPLLVGLLPSYLHMICNRIFLTKHRVHEMVVYDFLYKHYSKQLHLSKAKTKQEGQPA